MAKDISDVVNELMDKLTDDELDVVNIIYDYIDTLPSDFFKQSVEALNKHFGGHDNLVVTENVRKYLDACKQELDEIDELVENVEVEGEE